MTKSPATIGNPHPLRPNGQLKLFDDVVPPGNWFEQPPFDRDPAANALAVVGLFAGIGGIEKGGSA